MSDPMKYRTRDEMREAGEREPIKVYARRLMEGGWINEFELGQLEDEAHALVSDTVRFADESPDPSIESRFQHVLCGRYHK
jgi:TPP-dependent pyruvate/acetoin dehydrogenase alpha subunit